MRQYLSHAVQRGAWAQLIEYVSWSARKGYLWTFQPIDEFRDPLSGETADNFGQKGKRGVNHTEPAKRNELTDL